MKTILVLGALLISTVSHAQEFGLLAGVHQTGADSSVASEKVNGVFNFKLGAVAAFELTPGMKFRTGALYNQRNVEYKYNTGAEADLKFAYLDIPALVQYNFNEMFGLFGGLVIAVNINDDTKPKAQAIDATTMLPLLSLGANLMFQDMIGFDIYYERGMGEISRLHETYSTFGVNFLYWF